MSCMPLFIMVPRRGAGGDETVMVYGERKVTEEESTLETS